MNSNSKNNLKLFLKKIESRANYLYKYNYKKSIHINYNSLITESLMCNCKSHLVSIFKNYLIEDDFSEYIHRFYNSKESPPRLKKLFLYYEETSVIFPNYTPLIESKYLYNNVIRKQRIINEQQNIENKKNDFKLSKEKKSDNIKNDEKVFNSTFFGEILNQNESVLRIVFGIEKKNKKLNDNLLIEDNAHLNKKKVNLKNKYINENYNSSDDSEYENMNKLIKELETIEESNNINSLTKDKSNDNNNDLKYKKKILNSSNDSQAKSKNYSKFNNISKDINNIINISNSNINSKIKLNKINNYNQNGSIKDYILKSNKLLYQNEIIKHYLNITHSNIKKKERMQSINNDNNLTIENHKKNKSTFQNRSLFGLNIYNNNIINLLINQDKNSKKFNSNLNGNNTSKINNYNIYIKNHKFSINPKIISKKANFINTINYNTTIKTNKILDRIPKIDILKLDIMNNNKISTLTNRNLKRNNNYLLKNPNLFFGETEKLKSERNTIEKRSQKKDLKQKIMNNQFISFSPSKPKSKDFFGRKINKKLILISEPNIITFSQKRNKKYISNRFIDKNEKKLLINEYNFKANLL